jgi:hypothetical protein
VDKIKGVGEMSETIEADNASGLLMNNITGTGSFCIVGAPSMSASCIDFGPVKVYPDGRVERTSKFTTDEDAAKSFWRAVEMYMPLDSKTKSPPYVAGS